MIDKIMGIGKKSEEREEAKEEESMEKEVLCSICLEIVASGGDRSTAQLKCGHEFHLDCIGSAFNVKGVMQCPNCRKVEKGNWLFANRPSRSAPIPDLNVMDEWAHDEDLYDLTTYSEIPFGVHWCPFGRVAPFATFFEDGELPPPLAYSEFGLQTLFTNHVALPAATGHPSPYVTYINPIHANQSPSSSPASSSHGHHHHPSGRTVVGQPFPVLPQHHHHQIPVDFRYNPWESPFPRGAYGESGMQVPTPTSVPEQDGQSRGVTPTYDFLGINSSRAGNPTSLVPPLVPQIVRSDPSIPEHHVPPSCSAASASGTFTRVGNTQGGSTTVPPPPPALPSDSTNSFCMFASTSSNSTSEDVGGNQFYAWERDRFAPFPLAHVENHETGWWPQASRPDTEQRRGFWQPSRGRSESSSHMASNVLHMQSFM